MTEAVGLRQRPIAATRCNESGHGAAACQCTSCGLAFCGRCMQAKVAGRTSAESCPKCRGFCRTLAAAGPSRPESPWAMVADAFVYPLRMQGVAIILIGAAFFGFIDLLSRGWRQGIFFTVFGAGYLSAYLFKIVCTSAAGERELPGWPDFTDLWDSVVIPFLQMAAPWVACLVPAALPFLFLGWTPNALALALVIAGAMSFYLPMAILAIAVNGSVGAMHPGVVLPAIRAVFGPYFIVWVLFAAIGALSVTLQVFVARAVPFAGLAINAVVSLFLLIVEMRLLGLLYFLHAERMKLV